MPENRTYRCKDCGKEISKSDFVYGNSLCDECEEYRRQMSPDPRFEPGHFEDEEDDR